MKKVLIVGGSGYIGSSFARYAAGRFAITAVSSRGDAWRGIELAGFDSVLFAAGIAHQRQRPENRALYFAVNRDLAAAVAERAKAAGVGQFVYLSSMSVYGIKAGEIGVETVPAPPEKDAYGSSKYQAEQLLAAMETDRFRVALLRPPMVYGAGCPGKFPLLVKIAKKLPWVPTIRNRRSMIYMDNLAELLALVIEENAGGVLCPQNREYVCTADMLAAMRRLLGKKVRRLPPLNWMIRLLIPFSGAAESAFGSLYYSEEASSMPFRREYGVVGFEESVGGSLG